jgi:hypothetical protein
MNSSGSRESPLTGSCEYGKEPSGSTALGISRVAKEPLARTEICTVIPEDYRLL